MRGSMNKWFGHLAVAIGVLLAARCTRAWTAEEIQEIDAALQARVPGWTRTHTDSLVTRSKQSAILDASLVIGPNSPKVLVISGETILVNGEDITSKLGKKIEQRDNTVAVTDDHDTVNQAGRDAIANQGDGANAGDGGTGTGGTIFGAGGIAAVCTAVAAMVGAVFAYRHRRRKATP